MLCINKRLYRPDWPDRTNRCYGSDWSHWRGRRNRCDRHGGYHYGTQYHNG